ncbi:phospholipase D-like domain-containing protein [Paenibacillus ferrarius]|uniref:phospholipase D-like domain-containing protein n=1 Tax=Paenibacillus ferrarius TaxID=1469647 RepID=UPI0009A47A5C|nr:phospholipase D-like domain-containing protein [Paenibacillus ferrarius]
MRNFIGLITLVSVIALTGCSFAPKSLTAVKPSPTPTSSVSITPKPTETPAAKQQINDEYYFTKADQHPEKALIDVINASKTTLDIAIYTLVHPDIVAAIKEAKKRGVAVRIISDKIQSSGKTQEEAMKLLGSAGIPMMVNKHSGLMHLKVTIADKQVVTTGSYNYSKASSTTNDEVLMVIRNEETAKSFSDQFEKMWNDTKSFEKFEKKIVQKAK